MIRDRLGRADGNPDEVAGYLRGFTVGLGSYAAIVLGLDGEYFDRSGGSDALSSPLDRVWLRVLRSRADVIITSGATVRAERLLQPSKDFLVASKSGDLAGLRFGVGRLLVASDVQTHPSWPSRAEHYGSFANTVELVRSARTHWQNLQVELGVPALTELTQIGLIDRFFVTAPTEASVRTRFGDCERLFEIDTLAVYAVAAQIA